MTRLLPSVALLVALSGCPKPVTEAPPLDVDPVTLLAQATREPAPGPSATTFDLRLVTPEQSVTANGALVVAPPGRFRIEVRGPIGPPQLVIVGDGEGVVAYLAGKNELVTVADAGARIRAYTGGDVGLDALSALLLGRLPALKKPDLVKPTRPPAYRWAGPGQSHLDVTLDTRTAHLAALALADELGAPLLEADVRGKEWPERLEVRIPSKGVVAELSFGEWRPADPPAAAFTLPPPDGATVRPLDLGAPPAAPETPAPPEAPAAPGG